MGWWFLGRVVYMVVGNAVWFGLIHNNELQTTARAEGKEGEKRVTNG
jgi:hypothetical protein